MRVYVVVRTLRVDTTEEYGSRRVSAQPVIDGVFDSYEAARAFVEPLLEAVSEDFMDYAIFEKEVTESPRYVGVV